MAAGLVRCVACGEVQWNLRGTAGSSPVQSCRVCGEELRAERRRPGRRFGTALGRERRDIRPGTAN
jgi:hypothetical protein